MMNDRSDGLLGVLNEAYEQAYSGKGAVRHNVSGADFENQPIMWIEEYFPSFQLGQAVKKIHESQNLDAELAVKELLGAIVYLAAHVILLEKNLVSR